MLGQPSIASSVISFRLMSFSPLYRPSDVIKIEHSASFIRSLNEFAENPAKTTECMAPILAHDKTAIASSGTIGMYRHTRSPFFIPLFLKTFANLQTSFFRSW